MICDKVHTRTKISGNEQIFNAFSKPAFLSCIQSSRLLQQRVFLHCMVTIIIVINNFEKIVHRLREKTFKISF